MIADKVLRRARARTGQVRTPMTTYIALTIFLALISHISFAGVLNWETNKAAAVAKARQEGKLVLMLRGNPACVYCNDAKDNTCETTEPNIVGLIQQYYVPWFANRSVTDEGEEFQDRIPLPGGGYVIVDNNPIIACIDPNTPDKCHDLSVGDLKIGGELTPTSFYARLSSHVIRKSKEKVSMSILWSKTDSDKFRLKLEFLSEERPFDDNSVVQCQLGRHEDEIIATQPATVKKNRLKAKSDNAKLKLAWKAKKKACKVVFKVKKSTLDEILGYRIDELPWAGSRVTQFKMVIDGTPYYFYPRPDFVRKGTTKTTSEFLRKD